MEKTIKVVIENTKLDRAVKRLIRRSKFHDILIAALSMLAVSQIGRANLMEDRANTLEARINVLEAHDEIRNQNIPISGN